MSTDLEELLQREAQVGIFESTGVFTLCLAEARRKLQNFQLASLEQAVLKLIQGIVRLEPQAIWMESSPRGFTICWADPQIRLEPEQFAGEFEKVLLGTDGPQKDLAIGLTSFLDKDPSAVWWAEWRDGQPFSTLNLFGGQTQLEMRVPPSDHSQTFALVFLTGGQPLTLDRQVIATRTLFCPILLLWNGRLMCELSWNPPGHGNRNTPYWADLYLRQTGPLSRGLALKPIGTCLRWMTPDNGLKGGGFELDTQGYHSVQRRYVLGAEGRTLHLKGRRPRLSGLAALTSPGNAVGLPVELRTSLGESIWIVDGNPKGRSLLLCVKHGVLLDPCSLPTPLGATLAVVATPDLEVDLSQFAPIVNSPSWQELTQRIQGLAEQVVRELAKEPTSAVKEIGGFEWGWLGAGLITGTLGAWLIPALGIAGFVLGGAGGVWAAKSQTERKFSSRMAALQKALKARAD